MAKVTKKLSKSFRNGQKPAFDFDRAVAETYAMFPDAKDEVFFIDVNTHKIIHPDPQIRRRLIDGINDNLTLRKELNTAIFEHKHRKQSSCLHLQLGNAEAKFVFLYLEKDLWKPFGQKRSLAENQHLTFDHELAHAVIPQALGTTRRAFRESIADAFAAVRHFQRYGTRTGAIKTLLQRRAALAFFNQDPEHFTSPTLELALAMKKEFNYKSLTPTETALMAELLATTGGLSRREMKNLSYHFNKLSGALDEVHDERHLRKFVDMTFSAKSAEMNKWAPVALQAFLDKSISLATNKRTLSLHGPYWKNVRRELKKRHKAAPKP